MSGCALEDGGLRLTFDLKSLEPSDLAFINVYLDTDGNTATGNGFQNGSKESIGVDCLLNFKIAATPTPSLILASLTEFRVTPLGAGIHNVAPLVTPHLGDVAHGGQPGYCVNLPAEILRSPPGATIRFFAIAAQQFYSYEPGETQGDDMDIGVGHPLGSSVPFEWVPDAGFISVNAPTPPALTLLSVVPKRTRTGSRRRSARGMATAAVRGRFGRCIQTSGRWTEARR